MKTILSTILCLCFIIPNSWAHGAKSKSLQVSPDVFKKLVGSHQKYSILLAQRNQDPKDVVEKEAEKKKKEEEKNERNSNIGADIGFNAWLDGFNSDETALIIFTVVGLVVVFAWIPYFPVLAYKAIKGENQDIMQIMGYEFTHSSNRSGDAYRNGNLSALKYSLYINEKDEEETTSLGFSSEVGHYKFKNKNKDTGIFNQAEGAFWLLGPSIIFGKTKTYSNFVFGKIDLLAGTSFDSDLGLVSKAHASMNFDISDSGFALGFGIGGLYLDMKNGNGPAGNADKLGIVYSASLDYAF